MIPKLKTRADGGFAKIRGWINELIHAMRRNRIIIEAGSGFSQTPAGVLPPERTPEHIPPLRVAIYKEDLKWWWTIYTGYVIARLDGEWDLLGLHTPTMQLDGTPVSQGTPEERAIEFDPQTKPYIYLVCEYEGGGGEGEDTEGFLLLTKTYFDAFEEIQVDEEYKEFTLWAEIKGDAYGEGGDYHHWVDEVTMMSGHFYANRPSEIVDGGDPGGPGGPGGGDDSSDTAQEKTAIVPMLDDSGETEYVKFYCEESLSHAFNDYFEIQTDGQYAGAYDLPAELTQACIDLRVCSMWVADGLGQAWGRIDNGQILWNIEQRLGLPCPGAIVVHVRGDVRNGGRRAARATREEYLVNKAKWQ